MIGQIICVFFFVIGVQSYDDHYGGHYDDHYQDIDYKFKYAVSDDHTYNYQTRDEYKDGKTVHGSYSLLEPDGSTRIVKYTADEYGFHAQVDNDKPYGHDDYKPSEYEYQQYKPSYGYKAASYGPKPSYGYQSAYPVHSYAPKYKPYFY